MKKRMLCMSAAMLAIVAGATADDKVVTPDSTGFVFTDVTNIPTNPVRDQNKSGTCWAFSSTSFFEDEILRKTGKPIDLSDMFTVRHCYSDKADRFVRLYGETNFAQGGSGLDVPYVWERYGAMPEEAYSGLNYGEDGHDHSELEAVLSGYVRAVAKRPSKRLSTVWKKGFEGVLDAYFGEIPETFVYEGKTYTPQSFAASLPIDVKDYVPVTSFTHHPFYTDFIVEVPDNWLYERYANVPLDELQAIVDNALEHGYPVAWAADVSEGGFKWRKGYAIMPKGKSEGDMEGTELARWVQLSDSERENSKYNVDGPVEEIVVTQEMRQDMFDRQETTDDHGMVIVGKAVDQNGTPYYKVKNSWNTNQVYNGFFYVSMPYFRAKTVDILVNREAIPGDIAKKIGR